MSNRTPFPFLILSLLVLSYCTSIHDTLDPQRTRVGIVSANFRHTLPAFGALSSELASRGYEVTLYTPHYAPDIQVQGNVERVVYTGEQSSTHMFECVYPTPRPW
eukprot:TRINITY_DN3193_c0_g2_i1.p1 TRINITY_DN3193_c0_g2~~TRINITY_DN3193_c0_g2_i1.p1  ORF type:complete len:105 (+),score=13.48 TRINITY_DN3193_c0_g2_i1:84-398(+)